MVGVDRTRSGQDNRYNPSGVNRARAQRRLPSLSQWTASLNPSVSKEVNSEKEEWNAAPQASKWKRPQVCVKSKHSDGIENQVYIEDDESKIPHPSTDKSFANDEAHELNPSQRRNASKAPSEASSSIDTITTSKDEEITRSQSSSDTNQQEATGSPPQSPLRGRFFRLWKHDAHLQDDHNYHSDDWSLPASNKWKSRAIINPFAKRRARDRKLPSSPKAAGVLGPIIPAQATELPSMSLPLACSHRPFQSLSTAPVSLRVDLADLAPLDPLRLSSADKSRAATRFRFVTRLSAPCSSRRVSLYSAQGTNQELSRDTIGPSDIAKLTPPRASHQIKESGRYQKPSTLIALIEIQRKRDARRTQHAIEKEQREKEIRKHGNDATFPFRRLIRQYRDALSPTQQQQRARQELPRLIRHQSLRPCPIPTLEIDASKTPRLSVFIRKRPLANKELQAKEYDILSCVFASKEPENRALLLQRDLVCHEPKHRVDGAPTLENHLFHFDGVFDEWQENAKIYDATVGPMVPYLVSKATMSGSLTSLTVFAYGQTGSGKTHTMKSIYRQAAVALFQEIDASKGTTSQRRARGHVGVSFYEIYMNNIHDLLNGRSSVPLMEDSDGAVQLPGLKELKASTADELLDLVQLGEQARATRANAVHKSSSRSHALVRLTLSAEDKNVAVARLFMVDLAGSERARDTQSDDQITRMEGAEINKSLLALKECIRALDRGASHIPFRHSKLTQLLRDSFLSQSSKTIMIATVAPCSKSCNHTLNTLRYADRLKEIGAAN